MHLYESHLGGYFITENEVSYEDLYCETCGDSDQYLCSGTCVKYYLEVKGLITESG